jgi:hypothetical protein
MKNQQLGRQVVLVTVVCVLFCSWLLNVAVTGGPLLSPNLLDIPTVVGPKAAASVF